MNSAQTRVLRLERTLRLQEFRTAVSLHSHTHHSKENLGFLPHYLDGGRIPVVSRLVQNELQQYEIRNRKKVDFHRAYWTPPAPPAAVEASETAQIQEKLGLAAVVSITDHDTIDGPLALNERPGKAPTPVSVEWTVPFRENSFHIGVHNLPPQRSVEIMQYLAQFTAQPSEEALPDLFAFLDQFPQTLLVLNHPCINFTRVGANEHWSSLRAFLARFRPWIHALELNGMRPWSENQEVLRMAPVYDLPVVGGGDRHGFRPNTMLNLSQAGNWDEFVTEIRCQRRNDVLVMPEYEEPVAMREFATVGDVLRRYPHHPYGRRRFTDRVFAYVEGYSWHPLSFYWDGGDGMPRWLPAVVGTVIFLASDPVRPIFRRLLSLRGESGGSGVSLEKALLQPTDAGSE